MSHEIGYEYLKHNNKPIINAIIAGTNSIFLEFNILPYTKIHPLFSYYLLILFNKYIEIWMQKK